MQGGVKQRAAAWATKPSEVPPVTSRRRYRRRAAVIALAVVTVLLTLGILYAVSLIVTAPSGSDAATGAAAAAALISPAWLSPAGDPREWQAALHQQSVLNAPPPEAMALHQILFVSCNRHDRSQAYWATIAVAAQCEMLSRHSRAAAAPCRRLYAGQTPLTVSGAVLREERRWVRERSPLRSEQEVPLGACGSVYDSAAAASLRAALFATTETKQAAAAAAAAKSRSPPRFSLAPLALEPVPLDAMMWLGDAIYADKKANGEDGQSLVFQHENSLLDVGRFWRTQRDAPEYNNFIASCVAVAPPAANEGPAARGVATEPAAANAAVPDPPVDADAGKLANAAAAAAVMVPGPPSQTQLPLREVWGTWDDHDMGKNDGGNEYPHRNVTQRFLLDFLRAPATDPRWFRDGVYGAHTVSFHAVVDNTKGWSRPVEQLLRQLYQHAICVLLLDVRTFRDPPNASYAGDMLGAAQWEWLEEQLQRFTTRTHDGREPCALTLIGGGIQLLLDEKPAENWAAFPASRDRLLGLMRLYGLERAAFLTGDVHMGELGGDFTPYAVEQVLGYPLVEATSSGLTHSANMFFLPTFLPLLFPSPRRLALYIEKNFGTVRLSLDLLRLPALREYLNDTTGHVMTLETPEERHRVRAIVQDALNVTFTIFSLPQYGQPVCRLNFPLSMLTYAHGPRYIDAAVDGRNGEVHVRTAAATAPPVPPTPSPAVARSAATLTTIRMRNGTARSVAHYPVTTPTPFVTSFLRRAQRYVFPHCSVSETLKRCIALQVVGGGGVMAVVALRVWRRMKQPRQHHQHHHQARYSPLGSPVSPLQAEFVDAPLQLLKSPTVLAVPALPSPPRRWYQRLLHNAGKAKKQ